MRHHADDKTLEEKSAELCSNIPLDVSLHGDQSGYAFSKHESKWFTFYYLLAHYGGTHYTCLQEYVDSNTFKIRLNLTPEDFAKYKYQVTSFLLNGADPDKYLRSERRIVGSFKVSKVGKGVSADGRMYKNCQFTVYLNRLATPASVRHLSKKIQAYLYTLGCKKTELSATDVEITRNVSLRLERRHGVYINSNKLLDHGAKLWLYKSLVSDTNMYALVAKEGVRLHVRRVDDDAVHQLYWLAAMYCGGRDHFNASADEWHHDDQRAQLLVHIAKSCRTFELYQAGVVALSDDELGDIDIAIKRYLSEFVQLSIADVGNTFADELFNRVMDLLHQIDWFKQHGIDGVDRTVALIDQWLCKRHSTLVLPDSSNYKAHIRTTTAKITGRYPLSFSGLLFSRSTARPCLADKAKKLKYGEVKILKRPQSSQRK